MTPPIRLFIDGVKVADGSPDDAPTAPYAIDGLTVAWGRPTTVDQPDASSCEFTIEARTDVPDPDLFASTIRLGRHVRVDAGDAASTVFLGSITDVGMSAKDGNPSVLTISVVADDLLADLNNRLSRTAARPVEPVPDRFAAVLDLARSSTPYKIDTDYSGVRVRRVFADPGQSETVADLLGNIATSVDGVLWSTEIPVHYVGSPVPDGTGMPGLWLESPRHRAPLRRLELVPPYVTVVDVAVAAGAVQIDPCYPDVAPIEYRQTMSDLVTGVTVTYYIPDPTDTTRDVGVDVTVVDPGSESPSQPWGVRRMTIDSELTTSADANSAAGAIVSRLSGASWRLSNIEIDQATAPVPDALMLKLISMRTRHGLPITITPLPPWAPPDSDTFAGYLEGGFINSIGGVWSATLWLSLAQGYGSASARWSDLTDADTWQWQDGDPALSWADLAGAAGPEV